MFKRFTDSRGSMTLEATLVFPLILFILASLIFFCMYIYQKLVVLDTAVYTAKERAATWDNSKKNLETGGLNGALVNDGLYWRILNDFTGSSLVNQKSQDGRGLSGSMLLTGVFKKPVSQQIEVTYSNKAVKRTVSVKVNQNIILPKVWSSGILSSQVGGSAKADIAEPVEFIRNFDLGSDYLNELVNYMKTYGQDQVGETKPTPVIASVRSNVNGQQLYHNLGCKYIKQINQENIREFPSEDAARAAGFHICLNCAKQKLSPVQ